MKRSSYSSTANLESEKEKNSNSKSNQAHTLYGGSDDNDNFVDSRRDFSNTYRLIRCVVVYKESITANEVVENIT